MAASHEKGTLGDWLGPILALAAVGSLLVAERRWPLRAPVAPTGRRHTRNVLLAGIAGLTVNLLERPLLARVTRTVERRRIGLLQWLPLPRAARLVLGVVLLDYTLYLWHVLNHRLPWLWRMHLPHHTDIDLDASTALRFHATELAASAPWRALQALLIGVGPKTYAAWQGFTLASILFHHSNLRLPAKLERLLSGLLTTPRMHGIHHSTVPAESNANWSSGLSLWDHLHGTYRFDVPQDAIEVGIPAWREPQDQHLVEVIAMPFRPQRSDWIDTRGLTRRRGRHNELILEPSR